MLNRVKVVICGKEYVVQTEEAPSYVYSLAKTLEKKILSITETNTRVSAHHAAVMVALSTLDELSKSTTNVETIRAQVKEYVDEAGKARIERDVALRENESLKAKIAQLENIVKLKSLKESLDG